MSWITYLALPLIAAAIGWFTNWIAVKMLFRPRHKIRFLFFEIQGIFPKRQQAVAEKVGNMVAKELFSIKDIKEKMSQPGSMQTINDNIEAKVDEYLNETFPTKHPMMAVLVGKKTRGKMKADFLQEFHQIAPEIVDKYMENLEGELDVESIIRKKISLLSPATLEELIMGVLKREFQFIELIGAVLGFLIGVIQVSLVLLAQ